MVRKILVVCAFCTVVCMGCKANEEKSKVGLLELQKVDLQDVMDDEETEIMVSSELKVTDEATNIQTVRMADVYVKPQVDAAVCGNISSNTSVAVYEKGAEWYKIGYEGRIAYVKASTFDNGSQEATTTTPSQTRPMVPNRPSVDDTPVVVPPVEDDTPVVVPPVEDDTPVVAPPVEDDTPVVEPPVEDDAPVVVPPVEDDTPVVAPPVEDDTPVVVPPVEDDTPVVVPPVEDDTPVVVPPVEDDTPVVDDVPVVDDIPVMGEEELE